jgi:Lrp/AsnC family transcriptional regulator, leucine-responsive regulatory protein
VGPRFGLETPGHTHRAAGSEPASVSERVLATSPKQPPYGAISCPSCARLWGFMPNLQLDRFDRRIVATLQADGRLSNVELAERIGLSPSPCLRRVKRLEREGYIDAYRAMLRRSQVGIGFTVFVGVKIDGHADDRASVFEEAVVAMPEVIACHMVSGEADYLLEVVVPDLEHYQRFLVVRSWFGSDPSNSYGKLRIGVAPYRKFSHGCCRKPFSPRISRRKLQRRIAVT